MGIGLIPLRNFADLGNGLYRSAQPLYGYEFKWLKEVLGIDIIINLRSEKDIDARLASNVGIQTFTVSVPDHNPPNEEDIEKFVNILNDNPEKKILFHCEHGHGRTSTFCVIARIAKGWTLEDALGEELNEFHYNFKHRAQIEFLKQKYETKNTSNQLV